MILLAVKGKVEINGSYDDINQGHTTPILSIMYTPIPSEVTYDVL